MIRLSRDEGAIIASGFLAGVFFIFNANRCNGFDVRSSDIDVLLSCLGSVCLCGLPSFYVYVKHCYAK
jgi:hypothetical protein